MSILLALIGAIVTISSLRNFSIFAAGWGAFIGWVAGEFLSLRSRVKSQAITMAEIERELAELRFKAYDQRAPEAKLPEKTPPKPETPSPRTYEDMPYTPTPPPRAEQRKPSVEYYPPPEAADAPPSPPVWAPITEMISRFFSTGNVFAKVGAILLFFGVGFLIKFVSELGLFPIEGRLISTAVGANVLIALGWRLRKSREQYALILQGTGFGIFFLTVFGAFRIWEILSPVPAISILVAATILFALLAVLQNSLALAALAVTGGFSAPILISTGSGNHVYLFSYYALLNLAIFGIAWFKSWRELNLIGFLFTYGVGGIWGSKYYVPENFSTVEPFLIFHFLLYVTVVLLFSKLRFTITKELVVDGLLVFGVPITTFFFQGAMLKDTEYGIAISCAALGLFYVSLAFFLYRRIEENIRPLVESFVSSGLVFTTLAVPFALSHLWTGSVWAIEGAALVWIGIRQKKPLMRYFGFAMQLFAYAAFFRRPLDFTAFSPFFNPALFGSLVLFASAVSLAYLLFKKATQVAGSESKLLGLFLTAAFFWWFLGWYNELFVWYPGTSYGFVRTVFLGVIGFSVFLFYGVARLLLWTALTFVRYAFLLLVPIVWLGSWSFYRGEDALPIWNPIFLGSILTATAGLFIATSLYKNRQSLPSHEQTLAGVFLVGGYFFWFSGLYSEFVWAYPKWTEISNTTQWEAVNLYGVIVGASVLLFYGLSLLTRCAELGFVRFAYPIFAFFGFAAQYFGPRHPLLHFGWIAWMSFTVVHYGILYHVEKTNGRTKSYLHFSALWVLTGVVIWYAYEFAALNINPDSIWKWVILIGTANVITIAVLAFPDGLFPFGRNKKSYVLTGVMPHLVGVTALSQMLNVTDPGHSAPLPYVPFLNPLGILIALSIMVMLYWYREAKTHDTALRSMQRPFLGFVGAMVFLWVTMGLIRTIHHYTEIPWSFDAIYASHRVQAALSIFWGMLALATMVFAHRKHYRTLWVVGCCLMVVVVGKLFLIDLKESGTLERIVSFIGTGILLLLTGYFAPIPPGLKERKND